MAKVKASSNSSIETRPGLTPESQENKMIALAVNLAEKQLIEGTASSQVITHFLKLGTAQYKLELEKMRKENELVDAKTKAIRDSEESEKKYREAIKAMQRYNGERVDEDDEYC